MFLSVRSRPFPEINVLSTYGNNSETSDNGRSENAPLVPTMVLVNNHFFNALKGSV